MVLGALGEHDAAVWLFWVVQRAARHGSTATSTSRSCRGTTFPPASLSLRLAAHFEESPIPYDVDLVNLRWAEAALIDEVRREGVKWRS